MTTYIELTSADRLMDEQEKMNAAISIFIDRSTTKMYIMIEYKDCVTSISHVERVLFPRKSTLVITAFYLAFNIDVWN